MKRKKQVQPGTLHVRKDGRWVATVAVSVDRELGVLVGRISPRELKQLKRKVKEKK